MTRAGSPPLLHALIQAFLAVFPAELPDKSMFATVALVARLRRPVWVWVGVAAAFSVHVTVAVLAGSLVRLLPERVVQMVVGVAFAVGAVLLWRAGRRASQEVDLAMDEPGRSAGRVVVASFAVVAVAEWGDLTQIATAGLAASSGKPVATALGAWLALASVAAIAVGFGRQLVARVALERVNYVGAAIFAALSVWAFAEALSLRG